MRKRFRWFLIRKLFSLLDLRYGGDLENSVITQFLSHAAEDQGFRQYIATRDHILLQTLGKGIEGKDYWEAIGRRLELGTLLYRAKHAHGKIEVERRNK